MLSISLKSMWNLMHVMQLLAYMSLVVSWSANCQMMLKSVYNAVTLENIVQGIHTSYLDDYTELDEEE